MRRFLASFLAQLLFLLQGDGDLVVDPPTRQRGLRCAQEHLVPDADAAIHLRVDIVPREELMLVEPAADAPPLQGVVEAAGEGLVGVAVGDEAGVEVERLAGERGHVVDHAVGHAHAAQEGDWDLPVRAVERVDADGRWAAMPDGF
jgi:hypothetical protein